MKATTDLQGVILAIDTSKRQPWYDVQWDNGKVDRVSARSIGAVPATRSQRSLPQASPPPESMTELLLSTAGADGVDVSSESSESEASDDEEAGEEELADGNTGSVAVVSRISDDGKVLAHNRSWEFCSSVLVEQAND
ncbi:hypothetical protein PHYSODRAFT_307157 [Phytophthora sojae]|uniref:Uncharacterized protein n=1 Tax=Phytophthora sojae (strain P6497) TaxID=1094619 RepID=G5AD32_PHYSP|nr:hypothetical protein PHYSODRAFT_307157 [Phytophthora sojae]EGZ06086.1 hypothetical protein PHYSODRAFT_307157 [Phytophthora sojae]|eukprot:XP_009537983.1 hypothetical protein PHYSODRAFT_307157 [Phytophthora sojae]